MGTPMMVPLPINLPSLRKESTSIAGGSGPESGSPWRTLAATTAGKASMSLPSSPTLAEDEKAIDKNGSLSTGIVSPIAPTLPNAGVWRTSTADGTNLQAKERVSSPTSFPILGSHSEPDATTPASSRTQPQPQPQPQAQKQASYASNSGTKAFNLHEIIKPWNQSSSASDWLSEEVSEMDYSIVPVFEDEKQLILKEQAQTVTQKTESETDIHEDEKIEAKLEKQPPIIEEHVSNAIQELAPNAIQDHVSNTIQEPEPKTAQVVDTSTGSSVSYKYGRISILGHAHVGREKEKEPASVTPLQAPPAQEEHSAVPVSKPKASNNESGVEWRKSAAAVVAQALPVSSTLGHVQPHPASLSDSSHMTIAIRLNPASQPIYHSMPCYVHAPCPKWTPRDDSLLFGNRLQSSALYRTRPSPVVLEREELVHLKIVKITLEQLKSKQIELDPCTRVVKISMAQLVATNEELKKKKSSTGLFKKRPPPPLHIVRLSIALLLETKDYLLQLAASERQEAAPSAHVNEPCAIASQGTSMISSPLPLLTSTLPSTVVSSKGMHRHTQDHSATAPATNKSRILFGGQFVASPPPYSLTHSLRQRVPSVSESGEKTASTPFADKSSISKKETLMPPSSRHENGHGIVKSSLTGSKKDAMHPQNNPGPYARGVKMLESSSWRNNK